MSASRAGSRCVDRPGFRLAGFSLLETLVAIGIIGVLAALISPAVQYSRESSRRLSCHSNLRQLGVALHSYHEAHGRFPAPRLYTGNSATISQRSAHIALLPFLQRSDLFDAVNFEIAPAFDRVAFPAAENLTARLSRVQTFICPSDSGAVEFRNSYRLNAGTTEEPYRSGPFSGLQGRRAAEIHKGLSQTAFASERFSGSFNKQIADRRYDVAVVEFPSPKTWPSIELIEQHCESDRPVYWHVNSGRYWYFSGTLFTLYFHDFQPNFPGPACGVTGFPDGGHGRHFAASFHNGTVSVLFGDGHVIPVDQSVDIPVWRQMGKFQ